MSEVPTAAPLNADTVGRLGSRIATPSYDRAALRRAIVHVGVGGFHRAHLATYVDELCSAERTDWSIVGTGVLAGDRAIADALEGQDYLYSLATKGDGVEHVAVIGSIVDYVHAYPDTDALARIIAMPETQLVSMTITEGGYPIDDLTGEYVDLNDAPPPAFRGIARGLAARRDAGLPGLTVLSCDNILANGRAARLSTLGAATQLSDQLADWIDSNVAFPNTMVDRITPATTDADRAWLASNYGLIDAWPVVTEPFRQWVVEDHFATDRLPLESLDVLTTTDVEPYEQMKLRLLNAAHSCLSYLSALLDITTVDEALAHPLLHKYVVSFLEHEARPVLPPVPGIDLGEYTASLIERFSNPSIGDQISRLCLDGSAKFPKFLMPTISEQLAVGGPIGLSALALAAWCTYLDGPLETLAADPLLDEAVDHARRARVDARAFLDFAQVFGAALPREQRFVDSFTASLRSIHDQGVAAAVDAALGDLG